MTAEEVKTEVGQSSKLARGHVRVVSSGSKIIRDDGSIKTEGLILVQTPCIFIYIPTFEDFLV